MIQTIKMTQSGGQICCTADQLKHKTLFWLRRFAFYVIFQMQNLKLNFNKVGVFFFFNKSG